MRALKIYKTEGFENLVRLAESWRNMSGNGRDKNEQRA